MSSGAGDLLALAAGALLPFAFAPYGIYPLAFVGIAILFRVWMDASIQRAAWRGWLFGLGMFGAGVYWVQISIHQFGLPVLAFSVSMTALFVMTLSCYLALAGGIAAKLRSPNKVLSLLCIFPAVWTLVEWLRGWFLTGFPWLNLGYSQTDSWLAGYAPVLGVYGVSLAGAVTAGTLVLLTHKQLKQLAWLGVIWGMGWGMHQHEWTTRDGMPVKVALIQGGIEQAVKWEPARLQETIDHYMGLSKPYWGTTRLIVWPETAVPAFYSELGVFFEKVKALVHDTGTELLIGVPYSEPGASDRYYNSVVAVGAGQRYDKSHLVPFGEFLPLKPLLLPILHFLKIPMSDFSTVAHRQTPLVTGALKLGVSVCYEDAFGEEVITMLPAANLLVNLSNDAWFGDSIAPAQHLQMARMRAIETGRFMLRSTNNGITAIINSRGAILARAPQFIPYALASEIHLYEGDTPYSRAGNGAVILAALLLVAVGVRGKRSSTVHKTGGRDAQ